MTDTVSPKIDPEVFADLLRMSKESLRWIAVVAADHSEDGTGVGQRASQIHDQIKAIIARAEGRLP